MIGLSRRSHVVAITAAGMSEVRSVLGNARLLAGERAGEVAAGTHDGNRDPDGLQPQQLRLGSAARVDVHERCPSPRERALHEPVGERDVDA